MNPRAPAGVSLSGVTLEGGSRDARELIAWVRALKVRWIQLDATMPGTRPRELDRSARRDLASVIRRSELGLAGLDLFIPPRHFLEASTVDRAVSAALGAIELASELGILLERPGITPVAVELPPDAPTDVISQLEAAASRAGVILADHTRPPSPRGATEAIGVGIDPAAMVAAREDVFDVLTRMTGPIAQARLSDTAAGARVPPGSANGRLDLIEYAAALGVLGCDKAVVVDLRGIIAAQIEAPRILTAWDA